MSSYFTAQYLTDIEPILKDWLTNSVTGKSVTNLPLSLANRAQQNLWAKKAWSNLAVRVEMSLTAGVYALPVDFGRIIDMHADLTGTGAPTYWFYEGYNYSGGYRLDAGFTKASGYARTITFHYAQQANAYMRYQKILDDFASTGVQYSFFPANLVILEAQKIRNLEKGDIKEYQLVSAMFDEVFKDFCNTAQWINYDPNTRVNDRFGNEVFMEEYSLNGDGMRPYSEVSRAFIL
jgi:hypothetical protein